MTKEEQQECLENLSSEIDRITENKLYSIPMFDTLRKCTPQTLSTKQDELIILTELGALLGQYHATIKDEITGEIPINLISILIANSGKGKDRTVNSIRNLFETTYNSQYNEREEKLEKEAEDNASEITTNEVNKAKIKENIRIHNMEVITSSKSTQEGVVKLASFCYEHGGAPYIYTGELGADLQNGAKTINQIIQIISEAFDAGKVLTNTTKTAEITKKASINFITFLGVTSEQNIIYDNTVRALVHSEFMARLGRRAIVSYEKEEAETLNIYREKKINTPTKKELDKVNTFLKNIEEHIKTKKLELKISKKAKQLLAVINNINKIKVFAENIKIKRPIYYLYKTHKQRKLLNIAGIISILDGSLEEITEKHIYVANEIIENYEEDIKLFEEKVKITEEEALVEEAIQLDNNTTIFTVQELKRKDYIKGTSNARIKDFVNQVKAIMKRRGLGECIWKSATQELEINIITKNN